MQKSEVPTATPACNKAMLAVRSFLCRLVGRKVEKKSPEYKANLQLVKEFLLSIKDSQEGVRIDVNTGSGFKSDATVISLSDMRTCPTLKKQFVSDLIDDIISR